MALADYFWPPEKFSATPILTDVPEAGWKVLSAVASTDEVGQVMRIDLDLDGRTITARSFGGEIVIETTLPKPKPHNAHAASSAGEVGHGDPAVPIASAAGPSRRGGSPAAR
ncbi:hypothetical protein AB0G02_23945 [Actinosynnema sp. NPDC023658]|uniref:hypothetical protein n=1 Tax=Actinosynnema sp. NPDC023658 TaxID=3155465 RepID=UPI0033E4A9F9